MTTIIKIPRPLIQRALDDLHRPHQFAYERVGFFSTRMTTGASTVLVHCVDYHPVADDHYINDPTVGVRIGPKAITTAMARATSRGVGQIHVHTHGGFGLSQPSSTDLAELPAVVESLENANRKAAHGWMILSGDDAWCEIVSKLKIGVKQIVARPTILWDVIKKASLSALWVPDRKRILLDSTTPQLKHRWFEGHETIHSVTFWHEQYLYGDSARELSPTCEEAIEAEANYGAGQLLFLQGRFTEEAKDMAMSTTSIIDLSKRFKNTISSTLWRYAEVVCDECPVVGMISAHPHHIQEAKDPSQPCRHCIESPHFKRAFGHIGELELFGKLYGYCSFSKRGPLGEGEVILSDANGDEHLFHFESFATKYDVLTLGVHAKKLS